MRGCPGRAQVVEAGFDAFNIKLDGSTARKCQRNGARRGRCFFETDGQQRQDGTGIILTDVPGPDRQNLVKMQAGATALGSAGVPGKAIGEQRKLLAGLEMADIADAQDRVLHLG